MATSLSAAIRRPPWLRLARAAWWVVAALALAVLAASIPGYLKGGQETQAIAASPQFVAAMRMVGSLASLASMLVSLALAVLLFARRRGDSMAVFLSFYLLVYGVTMGGPLEKLRDLVSPGSSWPAAAQGLLLTVPTVALLCLFPSGGFVPGWSRWLAVAAVALLPWMTAVPTENWYTFDSPASVWLAVAYFLVLLVAMYAQVYRYRRVSSPAQRRQTRWMVAGLGTFLGMILVTTWPYVYVSNLPPDATRPWWQPLSGAVWWLTLDILPLSLSVAILRDRLFDIDILIRRTLIYGVLTTTLALVYFGGVVVIQQILRTLTGQSSEIAIVASTLAIAALFNPLRRRVQDTIDRRLYRRKYDAAKVLAEFAATARDEVELDKLAARLVEVVDETMQPESVSLWLKPAAGHRRTIADRSNENVESKSATK